MKKYVNYLIIVLIHTVVGMLNAQNVYHYNDDMYINGLSIKSTNNLELQSYKTHLEYNSSRGDNWGEGVDWSLVKIRGEEDDYEGTFVTNYNYIFSRSSGFSISVAGTEGDYGYVSGLSIRTDKIIFGFLNTKFKIGQTTVSEIKNIFYNSVIVQELMNTKSYNVLINGGVLKFHFGNDHILTSINLSTGNYNIGLDSAIDCTLDTDQDGINDRYDKCLNEKGIDTTDGCPTNFTIPFTIKNVSYKANSSNSNIVNAMFNTSDFVFCTDNNIEEDKAVITYLHNGVRKSSVIDICRE